MRRMGLNIQKPENMISSHSHVDIWRKRFKWGSYRYKTFEKQIIIKYMLKGEVQLWENQ